MVRAATRRDPDSSGCRAMVRDRIADRLGRHLGDHHAQAIEVGVDRAGRAGEREVAVVTGVRRVDRTRQAVVARCGPADGTRPSSTGRWWRRPPAWCWSRAPTARRSGRERGSGKPGTSGGALGADEQRCRRSATMSPTAFTTTSAPTTTSPSPCRRAAEAARGAVLGAPPLRDPSRRGRHRPVRWRTAGVGILSGGERGAALVGPRAARRPRPTRSKIAAAGTIGTGPPSVGKPAALLGQRLHHAVGGGETERRTAGQHDRVDVLDAWRAGRAPRSPGSPGRRRGSRPSRRSRAGAPRRSRRCRRRSSARPARPGTSVITSAGRGGGALVERAGAGAAGLALGARSP